MVFVLLILLPGAAAVVVVFVERTFRFRVIRCRTLVRVILK